MMNHWCRVRSLGIAGILSVALLAIGTGSAAAQAAMQAAPPPVGIIMPPAMMHGTAILRGVNGCTSHSVVTSTVTGGNVRRIVFRVNKRVVKQITPPSLSWRTYTIRTLLPANNFQIHTVIATVSFASGSTPQSKTLIHRFRHCRLSAVAG